jgi:hypothetical protein
MSMKWTFYTLDLYQSLCSCSEPTSEDVETVYSKWGEWDLKRLYSLRIHWSGITNPADIPSHGLSVRAFVNKLCPEWLGNHISTTTGEIQSMPKECKTELKVQKPSTHNPLVAGKFSMSRLCRVTAYILSS